MVSHRPGAKAPSDFATFPVSSFIKVTLPPVFLQRRSFNTGICSVSQAKEEKQGGTRLVGRVSIPCCPGQEQVHRLVLSPQQLQQVHRLLAA